MVCVDGVSDPRVKSCATVSAIVNPWLGVPLTSCVLMLTLYVPGAALFGILMEAVTVTTAPLPMVMGFAGLRAHCAAGRAVASQLALT